MTADSLLLPGLSTIASDYDGILCDVWGVVHNGVRVNPGAADALTRFREGGGRVILITNAPRPSAPIYDQLDGLGFAREAYDSIVTSGDVTHALLAAHAGDTVVHIGPERDYTLYEGTGLTLVEDASKTEDGGLIVCTGLYDGVTETPENYHERFKYLIDRGFSMICANPDVVVERGNTLIWCAGALARDYGEMGGKVQILGKPYKPIYDRAIGELERLSGHTQDRSKVLAIGDGLPTDIKGACQQGLDVLFITAGIHAADFGAAEMPDCRRVEERLADEGLSARAAMPRLSW
ncbi:TIGR01459 family HAD-type hydrolase [Breoghania sp.]|uniref:TIGR01459 family HAD-type hydrolase n=1 Tax=Breoghania sp. TaxID=2065378 RepID=UPI0026077200|nr:TIGR01459 family HAD-type hydrolase [Breoghania sp.]MDJ0930234.1 TIGR01459 family HAD-type hydrolase [Breoghania sp.]